jgi:hypothetical protein
MRERIRFEMELAALGLRPPPRGSALQQSFEMDEPAAEREARPRRVNDKFDRYRIRGGLYSAKEKAHAATHPDGLLLTVPPVIGRQERDLVSRGPATIRISKEMARFEGGKLGDYVQRFNEFSNHCEEVLRHIGRLRDLLSAGAPEAPTDMTARQKFSLRPTDNTQPSNAKKKAYTQWRAAQRLYAETDRQGNLSRGSAHDVVIAGREFDEARMDYWQAVGQMRRTIAEARRLNKPTFDMDIKLADVVEVLQGEWGLLHAVDYVLEARAKRREYDARMKVFADVVKNTDSALRDHFEALKNAGEKYWRRHAAYRTSLDARAKARGEARRLAAELGQELAPPSERRDPVLASIRMPALVADAWRVLAIIGPQALKRLTAVLASDRLLGRANFHFARPDPFGVSDMTAVRRSFAQAQTWKEVLTRDDVEEWVAMNRLWDETFNRFHV